jgi:hypothetical protein
MGTSGAPAGAGGGGTSRRVIEVVELVIETVIEVVELVIETVIEVVELVIEGRHRAGSHLVVVVVAGRR